FLYTDDNAFKLRGTPSVGADVVSNVFRHHALFYTIDPATNLNYVGALEQNESGLHAADNRLDMNHDVRTGACDFDADGADGRFFATGETWWFSSGGTGPWTYLATSKLGLDDVALGDVDHDGRCDVTAAGAVYPGGRDPLELDAGNVATFTTP